MISPHTTVMVFPYFLLRTITESEMATDRPSKSLINAGSEKGINSEVVTIKTITKGNNKN